MVVVMYITIHTYTTIHTYNVHVDKTDKMSKSLIIQSLRPGFVAKVEPKNRPPFLNAKK